MGLQVPLAQPSLAKGRHARRRSHRAQRRTHDGGGLAGAHQIAGDDEVRPVRPGRHALRQVHGCWRPTFIGQRRVEVAAAAQAGQVGGGGAVAGEQQPAVAGGQWGVEVLHRLGLRH
jgi:hypothetical protein